MPLVKLFSFNLVRPKIILRKYFFDEILLDKKKANYGTQYLMPNTVTMFSSTGHLQSTHDHTLNHISISIPVITLLTVTVIHQSLHVSV